MPKTKVLIAVKTYPTLSEKYDELVCTAGFLEDGSWIRIYPIPFRKLHFNEKFAKWQWIEIDLVKNDSDFRPESFRPKNFDEDIILLDKIGTEDNWGIRKEIVLNKVWDNMSKLIEDSKHVNNKTSLAVLKPKKVIDFVWKEVDREWNKEKLNRVIANQKQISLFEEDKEANEFFKVVNKLPYEFSYIFSTEDGKERKLMIEDWELGMLYWNCLKSANGDESIALKKVREKFFDLFVNKRDLYFFLGTTKKFHAMNSRNPFIIIGTFRPEKENQYKLF
jgi:hypothetical protein